MRWKSHVRFGGRAGETHQPKDWQGGSGSSSGKPVVAESADRPETPIGGPAGEH